MTLKTIAAAASIFLATATGATAATLTFDGGHWSGATGVDVDGTLYDVAFVDGTCVALFDGCDSPDDFTFPTYASAEAALRALLDQVWIDAYYWKFDSQMERTSSCYEFVYLDFCLLTPTRSSGGVGLFWSKPYILTPDPYTWIEEPSYTVVEPYREYTPATDRRFAKWTEAALAPVPLPAGGLLLLGGLGGFAALKRRKKRAA